MRARPGRTTDFTYSTSTNGVIGSPVNQLQTATYVFPVRTVLYGSCRWSLCRRLVFGGMQTTAEYTPDAGQLCLAMPPRGNRRKVLSRIRMRRTLNADQPDTLLGCNSALQQRRPCSSGSAEWARESSGNRKAGTRPNASCPPSYRPACGARAAGRKAAMKKENATRTVRTMDARTQGETVEAGNRFNSFSALDEPREIAGEQHVGTVAGGGPGMCGTDAWPGRAGNRNPFTQGRQVRQTVIRNIRVPRSHVCDEFVDLQVRNVVDGRYSL